MKTTVLSNSQIEKIDRVSIDILETIGVHIPHTEMLSRFADSGANVDIQNQVVRIPGAVVRDLLNKAGKQYVLYGRDMNKTAHFGYGKRNYNSIAGEASWLDEPGGKRRFCTIEDVRTAARLGDACENINIVGAMADPHEMAVQWRCVAVAAELIRNTTKPITFWFHDRDSARYIVDMVIALRGSREKAEEFPLCYPFLEPISPLRFPVNGIDLLFETARINMPVPIGPMAQQGLSAPATIAGTLAQENAEILAGICITQLVREGMPVCYGGIPHAFDMRTSQMIFSGPEQAIFGVAMTQMGNYYGLPVYINVGLTDSKLPDAQAGMESGITLAHGAAAGADIFGHMGICGVDQATSLDMLVLQNEVISYVESVNREIDFSDDAFGIDVIREAGPGGSFINTIHTAQYFRSELWDPQLCNRQFFEPWLDSGGKDMAQRCKERKEEILRTHKPEPVSAQLDDELNTIVNAAKEEIGVLA